MADLAGTQICQEDGSRRKKHTRIVYPRNTRKSHETPSVCAILARIIQSESFEESPRKCEHTRKSEEKYNFVTDCTANPKHAKTDSAVFVGVYQLEAICRCIMFDLLGL